MTADEIKTAASLRLRPNPYFTQIEYPFIYQRRAILLMLKCPRMVLGDDVGLGKSIEAVIPLTFIKAAFPAMKFIIFAEKAALSQWAQEFRDHTVGLRVKVIDAENSPDIRRRRMAFRNFDCDVLVTTYSMTYRYSDDLLKGLGSPFTLIMDEPNSFDNHQTILHQRMYEIGQKASRAYGLTATVVEGRLEEAFAIFRVVAPGTFESWKFFEDNFCNTYVLNNRKLIKSYKNLAKFREMITPIFYGRPQDDPEVKQTLPQVMSKDVEIEMGLAQSQKVIEAVEKLLTLPSGEVKQLTLLSSLSAVAQLCDDPRVMGYYIIGAKTQALVELLGNSLRGQKVLVFSKFRRVIDLLEDEVRKLKLPYGRITGAESREQRDDTRLRLGRDDDQRVDIVLMTGAGNKSLNLQAGGHLVCFDNPWSWGRYRQLVGRIKRTGSKYGNIWVYHFLSVLSSLLPESRYRDRRTFDHHLLELNKAKKVLSEAIQGVQDASLLNDEIPVTPGDLMALFDRLKGSTSADVLA